jgi:hypothetical protein
LPQVLLLSRPPLLLPQVGRAPILK